MTVPLVSVIIPCRDAGATLRRCLESVYAQTHLRLEVVVVDNGSGDDSVNIVEGLAARHDTPLTLAHCPVPGANNARNQGFDLARGDYIQWLDADDALHPEKIARQVAALEHEPRASVAYGDWRWRFPLPAAGWQAAAQAIAANATAVVYGQRRWFIRKEGGGRVLERHLRPTSWDDVLLRLLQDLWLPPNAYLFRRGLAEALHAAQAFHPKRRVAMDREYLTLAALLGGVFIYVSGSRADYYTWSDGQLSRRLSPAARAAELADIFTRLRGFAAGAGALGRDHHFLLHQPWELWSPHADNRRDVLARASCAREREVLTALLPAPVPRTLESWARIIAHRVPALWERHLEILRLLDGLTRQGVLCLATPPQGPRGDPSSRLQH